jgi:hypothetical protein
MDRFGGVKGSGLGREPEPARAAELRPIAQRQSAHDRGKLAVLVGTRLLESFDDALADRARHRLGELRLRLHTVGAKSEGDRLRSDPPGEPEATAFQSPATLAEHRLVALERSAQDIEALLAVEKLRRPVDMDGEVIHGAWDVGQLWAIPGR